MSADRLHPHRCGPDCEPECDAVFDVDREAPFEADDYRGDLYRELGDGEDDRDERWKRAFREGVFDEEDIPSAWYAARHPREDPDVDV